MIQGINAGETLDLTYPIVATVMRRYKKTQLRVEVLLIRDLCKQPLTRDEFSNDPLYMWSRYIAECIDKATGKTIQISLGATGEFAAPCQLRFRTYQSIEHFPILLVGRQFNPTVYDRKLMLRKWNEWERQISDKLEAAVELKVSACGMVLVA